MSRMDWSKLLLNKRYTTGAGGNPPVPNKPGRITAFQEDAERIIYSAAFRRLQGKTQVQPLPKIDYVRTRLTHTNEVASAARLIANLVAAEITVSDKTIDWNATFQNPEMTIVDVCVAAALAHDVGNPPFGHIGEYAVQAYFENKKKTSNSPLSAFRFLADAKSAADFLNFDGNAQGFRIITRLQGWRQRGGLQLSYPVLAAFTKYPYTSIVGEKRYKKNKYGFCQADRATAIRIFESVGMIRKDLRGTLGMPKNDEESLINQGVAVEFCRHPLAWITEAADDISYRTTDVEDAFRYGSISFEEAESLLKPIAEARGHIPRYGDISLEQKIDRITYLRAGAVSSLIEAAAEAFIGSYDVIMDGNNSTPLILKTSFRTQIEAIKKISEEKIYVQRDKMEIEAAGCHVIDRLLAEFGGMIEEVIDCGGVANINMKSRALYNLMPQEAREALEPGDGYQSYLVLLDYVTGMTDNYALELYQKVTGGSVALGRML